MGMGIILPEMTKKQTLACSFVPEQTGDTARTWVYLKPLIENSTYEEKYPTSDTSTSIPVWLTDLAIRIGNVKASESSTKVRCRLRVSFEGEETFHVLAVSDSNADGTVVLNKNKTYNLNYVFHYDQLQQNPEILSQIFTKRIDKLRCELFSDDVANYKSYWANATIHIAYGWMKANQSLYNHNLIVRMADDMPVQLKENEQNYYFMIPNNLEKEGIGITGTITALRDNPAQLNKIILQRFNEDKENWDNFNQININTSYTPAMGEAFRETVDTSNTGTGSAIVTSPLTVLLEKIKITQLEQQNIDFTILQKDLPQSYDTFYKYRILVVRTFDLWEMHRDDTINFEGLTEDQQSICEYIFHNYYTKISFNNFQAFLKKENGILADEILIGSQGWNDSIIKIPVIITTDIEKSDNLNLFNKIIRSYTYTIDNKEYEESDTKPILYEEENSNGLMIQLEKDSNEKIPYGKLTITYRSLYGESQIPVEKELTIKDINVNNASITLKNLIIPALSGELKNDKLYFNSTTSISLPKPNKIQIVPSEENNLNNIDIYDNIPKLGEYGKELKWKENIAAETSSSIIISAKNNGDYGTFSESNTKLEVELIKTKDLIEVADNDTFWANSKIYDVNASQDYQEVKDNILYFYDNITIDFPESFKNCNLKKCALIKVPENASPMEMGYEDVNNNSTVQFNTLGYEPPSLNTKIQLKIYDAYGSSCTYLSNFNISKLSPIEFKIDNITLQSHSYKIEATFTKQELLSYNDAIILTTIIKHPEDTEENAYKHESGYDPLSNLTQTNKFTISNDTAEFIPYENVITNLTKALQSGNGSPPAEIIVILQFKNFRNCRYEVINTTKTYNFIRQLKESDGFEFKLDSGLKRDPLYFNGEENINFTIEDNGYKDAPYEEGQQKYNYETCYAPFIQYAISEDNINYYDSEINTEINNDIIKYIVPAAEQDKQIILQIYAKINNQYIPIPKKDGYVYQTFQVAKWSKKQSTVTIEELIYNFSSQSIKAKLAYDEYFCGSSVYGNGSIFKMEIYDENLKEPEYYTLTKSEEDDTIWEYEPPEQITKALENQTGSDFYSFIVKATFINTATDELDQPGKEIIIFSSPYLISRLIDMTIRRGRVGINVEQNFPYQNTDNSLSTLEIHQRESTQGNQLETIKIVSCKTKAEDSLGPSIGFYSADNQCYGRISATSANLIVMTPAEVEALFKTTIGGDTNE